VGVLEGATDGAVFVIDESMQERYDVRGMSKGGISLAGSPDARRLTLWVEQSSGPTAAFPTSYRLLPNIPNPFNASTVLRYAFPSTKSLTIA
jgi:hypothetical protein